MSDEPWTWMDERQADAQYVESTLADRLAMVGYEDDGEQTPVEFLQPDERATVREAVEALREKDRRITELERSWKRERDWIDAQFQGPPIHRRLTGDVNE